MSTRRDLDSIAERNPEWTPWLGVLAKVIAAIQSSDWHAAVPHPPSARDPRAPLLAGAALVLERNAAERFFAQISETAAAAPGFATLRAERADANAVFRAALDCDEDALHNLAEVAQVKPHALRAIAALLPMPFLHACRRAWAMATPEQWCEGYCPVCGSWPTYAETCGVERTRFLRCGRCGSSWRSRVLACAYCGTTDHHALGALVPENGQSNATIEVCNECRGYVKAFTMLRATAPQDVMVEDLASVELDLVAAERGYRKPRGAGYAPGVSLQSKPARAPER